MTSGPEQANAIEATQAYLDLHFTDAERLAASAGIEPDRLAALIASGIVPAPSYRCDGKELVSAAFGAIPAGGLRPGDYHRKANAGWAARTGDLERPEESAREFESDLRRELAAGLAQAHRAIWAMDDSFAADGAVLGQGLEVRLEAMLAAHRQGVFAICVAQPDDVACIVRKEILQEKLTALTAGGTTLPDGVDRLQLASDIDAYAETSMPFTPLEYPATSRKRLVEDLRLLLGASG